MSFIEDHFGDVLEAYPLSYLTKTEVYPILSLGDTIALPRQLFLEPRRPARITSLKVGVDSTTYGRWMFLPIFWNRWRLTHAAVWQLPKLVVIVHQGGEPRAWFMLLLDVMSVLGIP
jgi:hypothetical protein